VSEENFACVPELSPTTMYQKIGKNQTHTQYNNNSNLYVLNIPLSIFFDAFSPVFFMLTHALCLHVYRKKWEFQKLSEDWAGWPEQKKYLR